jgi:peptidase E
MADRRHGRAAYLLAGGRGADPDAAARALRTALACARPKPSIAYVGAANGDEPEFFSRGEAMLREAGAGQVRLVPLVSEKADTKAAKVVLSEADLVFVSGGDVEAGMEVLKRRGLTGLLRELAEQGKPFAGVSAGSIMLASEWVRWRDDNDDSSAERFECLGIAPVLCDTHGEGDDWEELTALLALCPQGTKGYGLRSGSAIAVWGSDDIQVLAGAVDLHVAGPDGPEAVAELRPGRGRREG